MTFCRKHQNKSNIRFCALRRKNGVTVTPNIQSYRALGVTPVFISYCPVSLNIHLSAILSKNSLVNSPLIQLIRTRDKLIQTRDKLIQV